MKGINEVVKESNMASMIDGKLIYKDFLPSTSIEIGEGSIKYIKMRYLEGLISEEEHNKYNNPDDFCFAIYENCIFSSADMLSFDFKGYDEKTVDRLIDLRMILSDESVYIEKFDKLMLSIFCQRKDMRLKGMSKFIYEKYDWAKDYVLKNDTYRAMFLNMQNDDANYNSLFGIKEIDESEEKRNHINHRATIEQDINTDWILQKYGG